MPSGHIGLEQEVMGIGLARPQLCDPLCGFGTTRFDRARRGNGGGSVGSGAASPRFLRNKDQFSLETESMT
jgi:hypothetical protein